MDAAYVGFLIRDVARLFLSSQRSTLACCGPTNASECKILTEIGPEGKLTVADLARRLDVDKGWVSRVAEGLAQEGLVEKSPGTVDRRTVYIQLTDAGRERHGALNQALNDHAAELLSRIPPEKQSAIIDAMEMLRTVLTGGDCCAPQLIQLEVETHD
jgi:DNA-binding MarR family transcriptional regulator